MKLDAAAREQSSEIRYSRINLPVIRWVKLSKSGENICFPTNIEGALGATSAHSHNNNTDHWFIQLEPSVKGAKMRQNLPAFALWDVQGFFLNPRFRSGWRGSSWPSIHHLWLQPEPDSAPPPRPQVGFHRVSSSYPPHISQVISNTPPSPDLSVPPDLTHTHTHTPVDTQNGAGPRQHARGTRGDHAVKWIRIISLTLYWRRWSAEAVTGGSCLPPPSLQPLHLNQHRLWSVVIQRAECQEERV